MGVMTKFRDNTGVILWILIGSFGLLWVVMDVFDPNRACLAACAVLGLHMSPPRLIALTVPLGSISRSPRMFWLRCGSTRSA